MARREGVDSSVIQDGPNGVLIGVGCHGGTDYRSVIYDQRGQTLVRKGLRGFNKGTLVI